MVERLGEVLLPNKSQLLARPSPIKICERCGVRNADGFMDKLCLVCFRKIQFEAMPPDEQEILMLSIVPKKYIGAEMEHLPVKLREQLEREIDDGVLFWGAVGTGKTYTMAALAKKYIREGYLVKRTHYNLLCLQIRDTYNKNAKATEWDIIEPLLKCNKLFIEDVGTIKRIGEVETDFSLRTFLTLLDMRIEQCKPTFITSNKSVENLAHSFDERVGDRLRLFSVYNLGTKSRRQPKQEAKE